jgi:methionyl-tRNA formyltransferase
MVKLNNPKIVMCGCLETGWEVVRYLLDNDIPITYFVTITHEKAKQQKVSGYENFEDLSKKYNIPIYYADKYSLQSEKDLQFFKNNKFDLLIQGGWQRLFPEDLLKTLKVGAIGIHGSSEFLPKGRGRSPINWSLIENKKRFIIHYFLIKPGADDGDIFHFESFDINMWDTCRTLYYKNSIITKKVLLKWIPKLLNGEYNIFPQQGEPSYYPKRNYEDGIINWNRNVFDVYNFIRALTHPYPGAFSYIDGILISIWRAQPFDTRITYFGARIGEIMEVFKTGDFVVNCNDGLLLVTSYKTTVSIEIGQVLNSDLSNK